MARTSDVMARTSDTCVLHLVTVMAEDCDKPHKTVLLEDHTDKKTQTNDDGMVYVLRKKPDPTVSEEDRLRDYAKNHEFERGLTKQEVTLQQFTTASR